MATEISYAYLQNHPLFTGLPKKQILEAVSLMKIRSARRGDTISFGDGSFSKIYLLINGKIKIAAFGEDGNEMVKDIIIGQGVFGNLGLESNPSKDVYAEALTSNVLTCAFNVAAFKYLLETNSMMAMAFTNIIVGKLSRLENRHSDLVFCNTKSRLIHFIKNWAQTDGNKVGDKIVLSNNLTHTDIANAISTSRQSVNLLLNELREAGMLWYDRKQIELSHSQYWN